MLEKVTSVEADTVVDLLLSADLDHVVALIGVNVSRCKLLRGVSLCVRMYCFCKMQSISQAFFCMSKSYAH